ncbi:MAG TPA: YbhB/YbcL family Raf kinase inhibitor-like protein [Noviherbaspirillum sp.]|jgi:Raf kinase inhibitor-like YbhB/YbcL family protein|uniref:YbhB/YbcL family Raf kinase inhibitor-like protein n=1 Tax=Noviherbaspirillum sp. TaxID=1926288 RepID=UPI002F957C17
MLEKLPSAIGHALHHRRAGLEKISFNQIDLRAGTASLQLTSLAFGDHEAMPARFTADGEGTSPPLEWTGVPVEAVSLALIVEDADAPTPQPLVHAIAVDLPPHDSTLTEGALDSKELEGQVGRNSYLLTGWLPPDPPPGHGVHRYAFQLFALEEGPPFSGTPGRDALMKAIQERAIASGCLIGTYERPDGSIKVGTGATAAAAATGSSEANSI